MALEKLLLLGSLGLPLMSGCDDKTESKTPSRELNVPTAQDAEKAFSEAYEGMKRQQGLTGNTVRDPQTSRGGSYGPTSPLTKEEFLGEYHFVSRQDYTTNQETGERILGKKRGMVASQELYAKIPRFIVGEEDVTLATYRVDGFRKVKKGFNFNLSEAVVEGDKVVGRDHGDNGFWTCEYTFERGENGQVIFTWLRDGLTVSSKQWLKEGRLARDIPEGVGSGEIIVLKRYRSQKN